MVAGSQEYDKNQNKKQLQDITFIKFDEIFGDILNSTELLM